MGLPSTGIRTQKESSSILSTPPLAFYDCENVKLENWYFRTASSEGLRVDHCTGVTIHDCLFQALGQRSLALQASKNVRVTHCGFDQSFGQCIAVGPEYQKYTGYGVTNETGPSANFARLISSNILIDSNKFQNNGTLFPDECIHIHNFCCGVTIGTDLATNQPGNFDYTQVAGNTFANISGPAVGYGGEKILIGTNTFTRCCSERTDNAVVYTGRAWDEIGNRVTNNTFNSCVPYYADPTKPSDKTVWGPGQQFGEVACIMLDDLQCGQHVIRNVMTGCTLGIISNSGRYNEFTDNTYVNGPTNASANGKFRAAIYYKGDASNTGSDYQTVRDRQAVYLIQEQWNLLRKVALAVRFAAGGTSFNPLTDPGIMPAWDQQENGAAYLDYSGPTSPKEMRRLMTTCYDSYGNLRPPVSAENNLLFNDNDAATLVLLKSSSVNYLHDWTIDTSTFIPHPATGTGLNNRTYFVAYHNVVNNPYQIPSSQYVAGTTYEPDSLGGTAPPTNIVFWYGYIANPHWANEFFDDGAWHAPLVSPR